MHMSIKMPQHLQPVKQQDIEYSLNLDPLKKKKKPSPKKKKDKSKKSKKDRSKKSKSSDSDGSDNVEVNFDSEEFGSSDETERTLMMNDSFSSDVDSLKSAEKKESKKDKKKKDKKSKTEGKSDDKKEKKKDRKPKSMSDLDLGKKKKKPKRSTSMVVTSKKEKKKERKVKSERNLEEKKEKKKKDKKIKSERHLDEMKEKKKPKRSKSEIVGVNKKTKRKDKKPKSERSLGEFVSRSFKTGLSSINEGKGKNNRSLLLDNISNHTDPSLGKGKNDRSLLLDNISNHTDPSFVKEEKVKLGKMSKAEKKIMKPKIGEKFVEFCKSGDDEHSGLVLEVKGNFVFVKSVEKPAPTHNLHPRDRVIALNGKKIEDYNKDIDLITAAVESGKAIRLVISPTMLR